jgi:predicted Zn-dependent protease
MPGEALGHVEYLARKHPADPEVQVRLAQCHFDLGRPEEAQRVVERVLADHSHFRPALCFQGELALQLNRPGEAEAAFREALALDPADYTTQFNLCKSLRQQGKSGAARAEEARLKVMETDLARLRHLVRNEIARAPDDPRLLTEVGTILLRGGSRGEGLQWLHRALQKDPSYRPAHRALAAHYEQAGDAAKAAEHRRFLGGEEEARAPEVGPPRGG